MRHKKHYQSIREAAFDGQYFEPKQPEFSVDFAPGSEEKIAIMRQRLDLGQEAFHPDDRADFYVSQTSSRQILGSSLGDNAIFFRKPD